MTAQLITLNTGNPQVTVTSTQVQITNLTSQDPDLIQIVGNAADPAAAVDRILSIGARATIAATASLDTTMVETSFADLQARMAELLQTTAGTIDAHTKTALFDPDTGLDAAARAWTNQFSELVTQTLDPANPDGSIGKLVSQLQTQSAQSVAAHGRLLNPDVEDTPLFRLAATMRDQFSTVLQAVSRVGEQIAAEKAATTAARRELDRSTAKGVIYEDHVGRAVTDIATRNQDVTASVGARVGATAASKTGDIEVDLSGGGRYVIECKDRRVPLRTILAELERAQNNRQAGGAIAVFSSIENSPVREPIATFGDKVIVVLDKDNPDPTALRLACAWARACAHAAHQADESSPADVEAIIDLMAAARRSLARISQIRSAHTQAIRKIEDAGGQLTNISTELNQIVTTVEDVLRPAVA